MYFLHHYNQAGFKLDYLLNLEPVEKEFMTQSMILFFEEETKKWGGK